jgi:hypothetical protein
MVELYVKHRHSSSNTIVTNHQKPWANIVNNHGQQSSKTMVNNRQKPLSNIIKNHGQQLSKSMVTNHQTPCFKLNRIPSGNSRGHRRCAFLMESDAPPLASLNRTYSELYTEHSSIIRRKARNI